jgi:hypothetical protein
MAVYLADEPDAYLNFRRHARHVWKRHLRALDEEIAQRLRKRRPGSP